ncbi:hypothetical protein EZS27_012278 [termite gut metagenome]|uniref:Uncharacterized protein n=1 Tax=termite gut metagenome TaxID=433724 RepID=A0A5J4S292_9ZZZZ
MIKHCMKYLLSLILAIVLLISCQKEDRNFEIAHKFISFSPNISQTDTRATDEYSLSVSDYFHACPTVTVRMIIGNEVKTAKYIYKADTKKLEYVDGAPLYYPEDNSPPYQLIISWPDAETRTQLGEADYRHQEDENSFIRCDMLSDTVNNAVKVEYLPIYFKHLKSKLTLIPALSGEDATDVAFTNLTVNGYKPFHNTANSNVVNIYQLIYNPSIEAETTISNNKVAVRLATNKDTEIEYHFRFDASNLKAGENREIKILIPLSFLYYEFE